MYRKIIFFVVLATLMLLATGCDTSEAILGPVGPAGPAGPLGPVGPAGSDASASMEYVGAEKCGECHETTFARFELSGHANNLAKITGGEAPSYPFDKQTGGIPNPPEGYTWADISYVVGGYYWKALFVDKNGYIITGSMDGTSSADYLNQYNFANETHDRDAEWASAHVGEEMPMDCARCHSTGYREDGNQDSMPGAVGTWMFDTVQCEACHGPGSRHTQDPYGVAMKIDRSSQLCGDCHQRGLTAQIETENAFVKQNEQYSELHNSKHLAIGCVACHDPHTSTVYTEDAAAGEAGITQTCETCHWEQAAYKKVKKHLGQECLDCHMPKTGASAVSDLENFSGDLSSHLFSINPVFDAPQFTEDGTQSMPYITLNYACNHCHGSIVTEKTPEQLQAAATGYHARPTPTPTPEAVPAP